MIQAQSPANVAFGGELIWQGFDLEQQLPGSGNEGDWAPLTLLTYWRVEGAIAGPRRIFLHLVDGEGNIVAQFPNENMDIKKIEELILK